MLSLCSLCLGGYNSGELEAEVHFAYGNAVACAEGLEGVGREALVVDCCAVHRAQVFDVELVACAGHTEVASRHAEVETTVRPQVNVGVAVALRVATAHDYLCAARHRKSRRRGRRGHYKLCHDLPGGSLTVACMGRRLRLHR